MFGLGVGVLPTNASFAHAAKHHRHLPTTWLAVVVVLYVHDLKRRRCWVFVDVKYHAARVCTDCDD